MAVVALVISIAAAVWLDVRRWAAAVAALSRAPLGAVVSVVQRINAGDFALEYDVGRPYAFFLGGLRPVIGGAFALAIAFAFIGGFMHLPVGSAETQDTRGWRCSSSASSPGSASAGRRTRSRPRCRRPPRRNSRATLWRRTGA